MLKKDLPDSILSQVNFDNEKGLYQGENMREVSSDVLFYESGNLDKEQGVSEYTGQLSLEQSRHVISKDVILDDMMLKYSSIMGSAEAPTATALAIDLMLNSNDLQGRIVEKRGRFFKEIVLKNQGNATVIHGDYVPITPDNYSTATTNMKFIPQMYIVKVLDEYLKNYAATPNNPPSFIKRIKEHYGAKQN
jgi:hypothetical protein